VNPERPNSPMASAAASYSVLAVTSTLCRMPSPSVMDAFVKREPDLARSVLLSDDIVDGFKDSIHNELVSFMQNDPSVIPQGIDLILVARHLERIADHATNIAEDTLFLIKGVDVRHHLEPNAPK
jgi:phosphate uptake regulator